MRRLIINLIAVFVIGMGGFALAQPVQPLNAIDAELMAKCTDQYGEMEGDNCSRNENGTCFCWDNKVE